MGMSLQAANPYINATVTASAGSGKTYMLVTRILRLLLEGIDPGSILALTFTRKAAAEMQQRLSERLFELATADEPDLDKLLAELELGEEYRDRARRLYEYHQYCDYPVRTLTFHSFCQDLLSRFPLEADVPPNFDLLESSELLIQQARDALYNEATLDMQGELAQHMQHLMQQAGSLFSLDKVLHSFLQHRSDWWAYTDGHDDPLEFASQQLASTLGYQTGSEPLREFFSARCIEQITQFAKLLAQTGGKKNLQAADTLANWLVQQPCDAEHFAIIRGCFLTASNTPLVQGRKDSAALRKSLKDDTDSFLELQNLISNRIIETLDQLNKQYCWQLNVHWYYCGEKFVACYQQLKRQQRLLDFTDLEWRSYKLLQASENALWIQYKLDQQVQHLLIDEFQDTNPTQWQLILPLLEEMAAAESEHPRSVFLVGDEKQSIYSFRRAKPELQQQASDWLAQNLNARAFPLNKSWRSSPAIINTVNAVFSQEAFANKLSGFSEHQTHHQNLPGRVEVLPVWQQQDMPETDEEIYCRNPLKQPRAEQSGLHQLEAEQIAQHIKQLVADSTLVSEDGQYRPVNYNDIFILVRKRSHVADYERALRDAGIAYLGTNRGTFLDCLEIQDMDALLDTLLTPFNNLSLAQVLKSPLFNASDDDLQLIAQHTTQSLWLDRITELAQQLDDQHPLYRASILLTRWRELADKIPVHDLLDKIFDEGDLLERYQRATPPALQGRVQANLTQFLEMALDLDSGRYPSLMHFLHHLRSLKTTQSDAPDEAPMETREPRVRIMTIHASKGLEAPVIYLADSITSDRDRSSLSSLIDWPVEEKQPRHFLLLPASAKQDSVSSQLNQLQKDIRSKENANLLYVAITRARQYLFVSGCRGKQGPFIDWYQPIFTALQKLTGDTDSESEHMIYTFGESSVEKIVSGESHERHEQLFTIDPALQHRLENIKPLDTLIAPSKTDYIVSRTESAESDSDAQLRGVAIHRMLELLCENPQLEQSHLLQRVMQELRLSGIDETTPWLEIALNNFQSPSLQSIFRPENALHIFNECPVHFTHKNQPAYGVIDRVIVNKDTVMIIDYKTHQQANRDNLPSLAVNYTQQMTMYADACRQLWPDKTIYSFLLFTECVTLFPLDKE